MKAQFAAGGVPAADVFQALNTIVNAVADWLREEQRTRVVIAQTDAWQRVQSDSIRAQRDFLLKSLDLVFDERRTAFTELFARLDDAIARGDSEQVSELLSSITTLAASSPFADLRDHRIVIEQFRSDQVWEV